MFYFQEVIYFFRITYLFIFSKFQAVGHGMTGAKYVWIIPGEYSSDWTSVSEPNLSCSELELFDAIQGSLTTTRLPLSSSGSVTAAGMVRNAVIRAVQK